MTDRAVLLSIKPKYCELIASGKKTVEVRKTRPKIPTPFKCYIYCTKPKMITKYVFKPEDYPEYMRPEKTVFCKVPDASSPFCSPVNGNSKVIGEFVCDKIITVDCDSVAPFDKESGKYIDKETCLSRDDFVKYTGCKIAYGWHISDLKIYNNPKTLDNFRKPCICPEMPYCPLCEVGYEYISETDAEFYRVDGECDTEWRCLNWIKKPPQSWCYVQEVE